jgi:hypothetical protein
MTLRVDNVDDSPSTWAYISSTGKCRSYLVEYVINVSSSVKAGYMVVLQDTSSGKWIFITIWKYNWSPIN